MRPDLRLKLTEAALKEAARLDMLVIGSELLEPEMCLALYTPRGEKWLHSSIDEEGVVTYIVMDSL